MDNFKKEPIRILILSLHFVPDISAGAFRVKALLDELQTTYAADVFVDLITTTPNRYEESSKVVEDSIKASNINVNRISVPHTVNGILGNIIVWLIYAFYAYRITRNQNYKIVFATSSKLMTAYLGYRISKRNKSKLFLDIRDLFPDTIASLKITRFSVIHKIISYTEKITFRHASVVNIVSDGFRNYVSKFVSGDKIRCYTNGVDEVFLNYDFKQRKQPNGSKRTLLYIGNIGEGQGLEEILPHLLPMLPEHINVRVIGSGNNVQMLKNRVSEFQHKISIEGPMPREKICQEYAKADFLFLHLRNVSAFEKVLPSKIFEYGSTGKPILAGVNGYSAKFIKNNLQGVEVFEPHNSEDAIIKLSSLDSGPSFYNRTNFKIKFSRKKIIKGICTELLRLI